MAQFKPPLKEHSRFIKFFRNKNQVHDPNNEKPASVIENLNRDAEMMHSPY